MKDPGKMKNQQKCGQVMVEYVVVLLSVVLMYFMIKGVLWGVFINYGERALDLILWRYP